MRAPSILHPSSGEPSTGCRGLPNAWAAEGESAGERSGRLEERWHPVTVVPRSAPKSTAASRRVPAPSFAGGILRRAEVYFFCQVALQVPAPATRAIAGSARDGRWSEAAPPLPGHPGVRGGLLLCHGTGEDDMHAVQPDDLGYALFTWADGAIGPTQVAPLPSSSPAAASPRAARSSCPVRGSRAAPVDPRTAPRRRQGLSAARTRKKKFSDGTRVVRTDSRLLESLTGTGGQPPSCAREVLDGSSPCGRFRPDRCRCRRRAAPGWPVGPA